MSSSDSIRDERNGPVLDNLIDDPKLLGLLGDMNSPSHALLDPLEGLPGMLDVNGIEFLPDLEDLLGVDCCCWKNAARRAAGELCTGRCGAPWRDGS